MSDQPQHKRIGELNGLWAFLIKVTLATVPILLPCIIAWCVWATQRIHAMEVWQGEVKGWIQQGPRFTSIDAQALELRVAQKTTELVDKKFLVLEQKMDKLTDAITELNVTLRSHISSQTKP